MYRVQREEGREPKFPSLFRKELVYLTVVSKAALVALVLEALGSLVGTTLAVCAASGAT